MFLFVDRNAGILFLETPVEAAGGAGAYYPTYVVPVEVQPEPVTISARVFVRGVSCRGECGSVTVKTGVTVAVKGVEAEGLAGEVKVKAVDMKRRRLQEEEAIAMMLIIMNEDE